MGLITTNFYDEITSPQQRGLFRFFDHVYLTKPGNLPRRLRVFRASPMTSQKFMANTQKSVDWDFKGADTKTLTHCFHPYPAMMIPQIAGRLIDAYGREASMLLDPYCGTGTSLVEANLRGINAKGSDLNPLARLIAGAKTARLSLKKVAFYMQEIQNNLLLSGFGKGRRGQPPAFHNIDTWFPQEAQDKLAEIKFHIDLIEKKEIRRFFLIAFSETVRECSYTRNGEFKLYRIPEWQRKKFRPDEVFNAKLLRNFDGLREFTQAAQSGGKTKVFDFDSVIEIPRTAVSPESVDLVVTSPPYGDLAPPSPTGNFLALPTSGSASKMPPPWTVNGRHKTARNCAAWRRQTGCRHR